MNKWFDTGEDLKRQVKKILSVEIDLENRVLQNNI
jgi:hypothetical protein